MKAHTNNFKENLQLLGRELDVIITYTNNNETITLDNETLNSINLHYQGNILKSVMKQLDIDSNNDIPLNSIINCQIGIKVNNSYEYLNYGNYIVYSSEKQEDFKSYKITCYDKMLYSMVDYEDLEITYPITIRNYINAICTKLGLTFANSSDTFANYNRQIASELYLDSGGNALGYTYRDVLDELAQVTASTICINNNDELEIRYITSTNDTIDEEFLKDTNVNFGEKYGPINSIVLSRSAETDNVYIQDSQSIEQNGLCELKIVDNQIMNGNDRSDYLPDLLSILDGLEYFINDYSSIGILYYELCDRYTVQVGENSYSCVMFNDSINITSGIEEDVYTEMPQQTETDYKKADKTDQKINQTYLIVDKQNQAIEGVVSRVDGQDEQIATIRLQYNELLSRISDIADITTSGESSYASVNLVNVNASQPIDVKIHPILEHVAYDYPHNDYPQIDYCKSRTLRFTNTTTSETFDWIIPTDLWYYNSTTYDELELNYGDGTNSTVTVTRKCQINADGSISALATPTTETYSYPEWLTLTDGDYTISLIANSSGYLYVQLMAKNIYTTQFYTRAETNTLIDQTTNSINLSVDTKLSNYSTTNEMNSAITLKANEITSSVSDTYATKTTTNTLSSRINQTAKSISMSVNNGSTTSGITITTTKEDGTTATTSGTIQMTGLVKFTDLSTSGSTSINGANITTGTISSNRLDSNVITTSNLSAQEINADKITAGTLSVDRIETKSINNSKLADSTITGGKIANNTITGTNIANATITNGKIADATITSAKISSLNAGKITAGSLTSSNVKIGSWSLNGTGILSNNAQIYPDYLGYKYNGSGGFVSQQWWRVAQGLSDKRLKKNINELNDKYDKFFDELRPVSFKWKKSKNNKDHIGFIAQEVKEAEINNNLDLDIIYKTDGLFNIEIKELIALNTWQIQKLKEENKELRIAIDELKQEIENIKKGK